MGKLILAKLNENQIFKAQEIYGSRKKITHVLICEGYGQIFGTEKYCLKYFNAWKAIFKKLFNEAIISKSIIEISNYSTTPNLVMVLGDAAKSPMSKELKEILDEIEGEESSKKKGFFDKLFG